MRKTRSDEDRFWEKVALAGLDDCWLWVGTINKTTGYGCIRVGSLTDGTRRQADAHRLSLEIAHGPLGDRQALHHCDNRACVNPRHLYAGTHADNMRDMKNRGRANGRGLPGERNGNAKLTKEQAASVINSGESLTQAARRLGVSKTQVSWIRQGKSWAELHGR